MTEDIKISPEQVTKGIAIGGKALTFWQKYKTQIMSVLVIVSGLLGYNAEGISNAVGKLAPTNTSCCDKDCCKDVEARITKLEEGSGDNTTLIKTILDEIKKK